MKKVSLLFIFSFMAFIMNASNYYDIVPKPSSLTPTDGVITKEKTISVYMDESLEKDYLIEIMNELRLTLSFADSPQNAFLSLSIKNNSATDAEGYRLEISRSGNEHINAIANTKSGLLNALQSLRQLASVGADGVVAFPCCTIDDKPAFSWRAFMLDESRHFHGMATVKRLLDEMA